MNSIKRCIEAASSVLICGHKNPDGDSIGSMLSLGLGLESMGKEVIMLCGEEIPQAYSHLPGIKSVVKGIEKDVDLAIAVDCASKEMIGVGISVFESAEHTLEIDHHFKRSSFAEFSLVDPYAGSAGELVYSFLKKLCVPISKEIAFNILTSIVADSKSFRLPDIRPRTFELCAKLLRTGVEYSSVLKPLQAASSIEMELLTSICLLRCSFACAGQLAWSTLMTEDFKKLKARECDGDSALEKIRSLGGVNLAILFREKENASLRVSFRSKEGINISELAAMFGGGGHACAAGCTIPNSLDKKLEVLRAGRTLLKIVHLKQTKTDIYYKERKYYEYDRF
ncbi:MAG: DHH family phosphoesterase [Chitinispirillales bacterium]|jgi:phosphoesterase RecJ-like protein|nr:DHH family phosphoesterase [Chitinispirillales bacterium]